VIGLPDGPDEHLGDLLSALVDGELSGTELQAAERHLAGCPTCQAEQALTAQTQSLVAGLPTLAMPPPVWATVMAAGRRRARPAVWLSGCAAAVALAILAAVPPRHHVTPQMAHLVEVHAVSSGSDPVTQLAPAAVPPSLARP
jgi:anti-sigma factor RsiW